VARRKSAPWSVAAFSVLALTGVDYAAPRESLWWGAPELGVKVPPMLSAPCDEMIE
jgi:hypothetical protein